jgi:hypothetical protein
MFFTSKERESERECVFVFTYSSVLFYFPLNNLAIYILCIGCDPQGHHAFLLSHHSWR